MSNSFHILNINDLCTGCGACASICPKTCIEMTTDQDGFYYPQINFNECIACHLCDSVCHVQDTSDMIPIDRDDFYVYRTKDEDVRFQSTSGGAFTLFANFVINQGGAVFASRYNGEKERLEVCSSDDCGLDPLRKSKYIESYLGRSLYDIKVELSKGRWVLYCGTPCQAAGLRRFIDKTKTPCEKLIIIDFACHGVPSNGFFTRFKKRFESNNKRVVDAEFRVKDPTDSKTGWHIQTLRLTFSDSSQKVFRRNSYYYYYYKPFDISCSLRRSCYDCHLIDNSKADITIGDFWDISKCDLVKDDNKGTSFIKIHRKDLLPLFKQLSNGEIVFPLSNDIVCDPYRKPDKLNLLSERERFLYNVRKYSYYRGVRKYFGLWYIINNTCLFQIKNKLLYLINGLR